MQVTVNFSYFDLIDRRADDACERYKKYVVHGGSQESRVRNPELNVQNEDFGPGFWGAKPAGRCLFWEVVFS
jgi:hypothetical protein